ncbi:MAG: chorismate synthase [Phycisphaerales bacterium]
MTALTYHTAGESHGPALIILVQGMPAGVPIDSDLINTELRRRQGGYGRGGRQRIETDTIEFLSGVRLGHSIGAPIAMRIPNKDSRLDDLERTPPVHRPRPGHADLAGSIKWLTTDCRETLERASARETASRTAAGALARCLLREFDIEVFGFLRAMLNIHAHAEVTPDNWTNLRDRRDASDVYCPDETASEKMREAIRQAKVDQDTVGGLCEAHVFGCPIGLGSCMDWRDKLDARLAYAVMGIQAFKAVEIGLGAETWQRRGSQVHDHIEYDPAQRHTPNLGFTRPTNNAGGLEGGMTNGNPIIVKGTMKPIATLLRGLPSINLNTKQPEHSQYERSDVCAASAASVVMENVVAFEVARVLREKFAGDSLLEMRSNYDRFLEVARLLPLDPPTGPVIA